MKAWKSRLLLGIELSVKVAEIDAVIRDLRLTAKDQRMVGSVLVLSPEICDVIAEVFERDTPAPHRYQ